MPNYVSIAESGMMQGMNGENGRVKYLIIGPEAGAPLKEVAKVTAEAGRGLVGDRYHLGCGSFNAAQFDQRVREVTLIDIAAVETCNMRLSRTLAPADFRRNIVTEGIDLSVLRGRRFRVGGTVLRWVRSAPPCRYLARLLGEDIMRGLKGVGGIRAVIEQGGEIKTGDRIDVLP